MVLHILWPSMHQPESLSYYSQWLPLISYYYDSICLFFCIVPNFNILKMPALLAHPGLFWCFRTPLNSDMDNAVYKVHMCCMIFLHAHTPGRPRFVISSKSLGVHPTEHYCDYSSTALESSAMVLFAGKLPSGHGTRSWARVFSAVHAPALSEIPWCCCPERSQSW